MSFPEAAIFFLGFIVLYVLIGFVYQWLTGKRENGPATLWNGFWNVGSSWRPPKAPEDEWEKWSKL